jgi:hypothetical protein
VRVRTLVAGRGKPPLEEDTSATNGCESYRKEQTNLGSTSLMAETFKKNVLSIRRKPSGVQARAREAGQRGSQ